MLLLSTRGRKTGKNRKTPLLYIKIGETYYSAASYGGNDSHPDWYLNIVDDSDVELLVEQKWVKAIAKIEVLIAAATKAPKKPPAHQDLV